MKGRIKLAVSIALSAVMLMGTRPSIQAYLDAVGLRREQPQIITEDLSKTILVAVQQGERNVARARASYRSSLSGDDADATQDLEGIAGYTEGSAEEPERTSDGAEEDSWTYLGTWTATAYCPCVSCTTDGNGYTASGTFATQGRTIACNSLPMGTEVLVNGDTYIVEDTGWSPYGDAWVDIYFDSHEAALAFGVQAVEIYVKE